MNTLNRRQFLHTSALGTAVIAQFPGIVGAADATRKLKLGLIGCGWYGMVDLKDAFRAGGVEVLALCDVDSDHLNASAAEVEKLQGSLPKTFKHYEELLGTSGLEAVIIATPPHWHALQLMAALRRNLDVYCEKPLSYDVREGRSMVDAVKRSGRIVQLGFQRRQSAAFQGVRRHLEAGEAGRIVCCDANIHYNAGPKDATPQPPPASLDWCGSATPGCDLRFVICPGGLSQYWLWVSPGNGYHPLAPTKGSWLLGDPAFLVATGIGGAACQSVDIKVPADPGIIGVTLYLQAARRDIGPIGPAELTNSICLTILLTATPCVPPGC
jgi:hypothetical protein